VQLIAWKDWSPKWTVTSGTLNSAYHLTAIFFIKNLFAYIEIASTEIQPTMNAYLQPTLQDTAEVAKDVFQEKWQFLTISWKFFTIFQMLFNTSLPLNIYFFLVPFDDKHVVSVNWNAHFYFSRQGYYHCRAKKKVYLYNARSLSC